MRFKMQRKYFLAIISLAITSFVAVGCEGESKNITRTGNCCRGHYSKSLLGTGCQNETLKDPFWRYHENAGSCYLELKKTDTDDLPTALWREYICIIKATGGNEQTLKTFKGFMDFMSRNYTDPLKSEILTAANDKCKEGETEKDDIKRLELFQKCLYQVESKVCHKPTGSRMKFRGFYDDTNNYCKSENLPDFHKQACCKGRHIPLAIRTNNYDSDFSYVSFSKMDVCVDSFVDRQKELDPNIKAAEDEIKMNPHNMTKETFDNLVIMCDSACLANKGTPYKTKSDLKIDIEETKKGLFSMYSKDVRKDLFEIFDKYMERQIFVLPNNSTLNLKETLTLMESKNEVEQIFMHCRIHECLNSWLNAVVLEHCYDREMADKHGKMYPCYLDKLTTV